MLGVSLAQELFGWEKLSPVFKDLRVESPILVCPRNFEFPFLRIRLFIGHEGIKGPAVLLPNFHQTAAWAVQIFFVTHGATLDAVVPAVYHTPDLPVRFVRKGT